VLCNALVALGLTIQESSYKCSVRGIWGKDPLKCSISDINRVAAAMMCLENGAALNNFLRAVTLPGLLPAIRGHYRAVQAARARCLARATRAVRAARAARAARAVAVRIAQELAAANAVHAARVAVLVDMAGDIALGGNHTVDLR
jgi:hypothetical protein